MSPDEDARERIEFDYAWGWFQYHASQRLTAFNFFLIIVGLLLVGFAQAVGNHWSLFGAALGSLGSVVAAGFLALDVRNQELVTCGVVALQKLELTMGIALTDREEKREHLEGSFGRGWVGRKIGPWGMRHAPLFKHRVWLRLVIAVVGLFFLAGAGWAAWGYPGTEQPPAINCRKSTVLMLHRRGLDLNVVQRSEQEGEQGGTDHDRGGPGDGLSGYLHVQPVGMGDHQRVESGGHCGEESVGGR
jgi:hypothetical protein